MRSWCRGISFSGVVLLIQLLVPVSLAAVSGEIVYFLGDVEVVRAGETHFAEFGKIVNEGDLVRTGAESTVIIDLGQAGELKLRENTSIEIDRSRDEAVQVSLNDGGLFSRVRSGFGGRFDVVTDTVVAGVRGTEFFTAFGRTIEGRPDLWLCVESGEVHVDIPDSGQSELVRAGEGINILAGTRLTTPRRYRWTLELNWNMNPEDGPVVDTTDLEQAYSDLLDWDYD